jgi:hypothetical protein
MILAGLMDMFTSGNNELFETDKSWIIHVKLSEEAMAPESVFLEEHKKYFLFDFFIPVSESQIEVDHFQHIEFLETD